MALRTNSRQAVEAVREHVASCIEARGEQGALAAVRSLKREQSVEWALKGRNEACREWLLGLGFGELLKAREHVGAWLLQTPEEAAAFSQDRCEGLYIGLVARELFAMADDEARASGTVVDAEPYFEPSGDGSARLAWSVSAWIGGHKAAEASGLDSREERIASAMLEREIAASGSLDALDGGEAAAEVADLMAGRPTEPHCERLNTAFSALREAASYVADARQAADEWRGGTLGEEDYYGRMSALESRIRGGAPAEVAELALAEGDAYFEESGCGRAHAGAPARREERPAPAVGGDAAAKGPAAERGGEAAMPARPPRIDELAGRQARAASALSRTGAPSRAVPERSA